MSTKEDFDRAVQAARDASQQWAETTLTKRRAALAAYADATEANADEFAKTLTMEQGMPLNQSATELGMVSAWVRDLGSIDIAENILEETPDRKTIQRYTPIGVAGGIVPWNFLLLLAVGKIIPAIYIRNAVIVKPLTPFYPVLCPFPRESSSWLAVLKPSSE